MGKRKQSDISLEFLDRPGHLFLNEDVVNDVKQLMGGGGKGTVDELAFGIIYDRIADALFPWCSTLTSRARYFFFNLAVIDLALERTFEKGLNGEMDDRAIRVLARTKLSVFLRHIQKLEKHLALTLVIKYEGGRGLGIFGALKSRRWLGRDGEVKVKERGRILSMPGRYPNAIYRGSCRSLKMFNCPSSSNLGILEAYIKGKDIFSHDWLNIARFARAELKELSSTWERIERAGLNFNKAQIELKRTPFFKNFRGFDLDNREAKFLMSMIRSISPYLKNISDKELSRLLSKGRIDLLGIKELIQGDQLQEKLLLSGYHIDIVTRDFRALYETYCKNPERALRHKLNKSEILESFNWLEEKSNRDGFMGDRDWGSAWYPEFSYLISDWISKLSPSGNPTNTLLIELCDRAVDVVRRRGQGKLAPHERNYNDKSSSEDDIKNELEIKESSFRLGNGAWILLDVVKAIK